MQTVVDIVTTMVICLTPADNLHDMRRLLKQHHIRHLPVVSETGEFVGLLSLNNAFKMLENYGFSKLAAREQRTPVECIMTID